MAINHRADTLADTVRGRAGDARDVLGDRWHDVEERIPGDLETVVRRGRIAAWELVRVAGTLLASGPRAVVGAIGAAGTLTDEVASRGARVGERARGLAAAVPPPRAVRRRARLRTLGWASVGFGLGFVAGWLLARRPAADQHEGWEPVAAAAATPTGEPDAALGDGAPLAERTGPRG